MDGNLETTEQQLERGWKVGWETEYPGKVSGTDPTTICRGQGGETEQAGQAGIDLHAPPQVEARGNPGREIPPHCPPADTAIFLLVVLSPSSFFLLLLRYILASS